jgi:plasmid stabilization system protein ParE
MKRVLPRTLAQQDIIQAFDCYLGAASSATAIDFVNEIDACKRHIERFRCLVFYFERLDYVDIVRVLHQHRDIPGILAE